MDLFVMFFLSCWYLDQKRSFTSYVFTIAGCAIGWKPCLQFIIAMSTIEAEYIAISEACKEAERFIR